MHRNYASQLALLLAATIGTNASFAGTRLPDGTTWAQDAPNWTDKYVSRTEPDDAAKRSFAQGKLGVLLASYDRHSLFGAYRILTLAPETRQQQSERAPGRVAEETEAAARGIAAWTDARDAVAAKPLAHRIQQNRRYVGAYGSFVNCGDFAFDFAAETLNRLLAEHGKGPAVQEWIDAQDHVFAQCGTPLNEVNRLAELPANAPATLRAFRQYQIATEHFYAGRYDAARGAFKSIAAAPSHPMRVWAAHASPRALVREASLDQSLPRQLANIRGANVSLEQKRTDWANAMRDDQARRQAAYSNVRREIEAILSDPGLTPIHAASRRLLTRARLLIQPEADFTELAETLARFDRDPTANGELDRWTRAADRVIDHNRNVDLIGEMRRRHEFFDWIRTVQGCSESLRSSEWERVCAAEHDHAVTRWRQRGDRIWRIAVLMTATKPTVDVEAVLRQVEAVGADDAEHLTLRYHAVRLLRAGGKADAARHWLAKTLPHVGTGKEYASARHLFAQEGFALARNTDEAAPYLNRWGADIDEWLNRRLSSRELLELALSGKVPGLRDRLLVAAWWRAGLIGNADVATKAADAAGNAIPALKRAADFYLKADPETRHYQLARISESLRLSPLVQPTPFKWQRPARGPVSYWCGFDSREHLPELRRERVPGNALLLAAPPSAGQAEELASLSRLGTALEWMSRIAFARADSHPGDPGVKQLLQSIAESDGIWCRTTDTDALIKKARDMLARTG